MTLDFRQDEQNILGQGNNQDEVNEQLLIPGKIN